MVAQTLPRRIKQGFSEGTSSVAAGGFVVFLTIQGCATRVPTSVGARGDAKVAAVAQGTSPPTECDLPTVSDEEPGREELHSAGTLALSCFAKAMNARSGAALSTLYLTSITYFGDSVAAKDLVARQLSEQGTSPAHYTETPTRVEVDSYGQIEGMVEQLTDSGDRRNLVFRLFVVDGRIKIGAINDAEEKELSERCSAAVSSVLSSTKAVQQWYASLPDDINTGGFEEPLKNGHFETTLGASLLDRMEVIYRAEVDFGQLRMSHLGIPMVLEAGQAEEIRKACVRFDADCEEACATLGQCTPSGNTCVASINRECEESAVCQNLGRCAVRETDGTCIATSAERCEAVSPDFCYGFVCRLIGSDCTAPPLDEDPSELTDDVD